MWKRIVVVLATLGCVGVSVASASAAEWQYRLSKDAITDAETALVGVGDRVQFFVVMCSRKIGPHIGAQVRGFFFSSKPEVEVIIRFDQDEPRSRKALVGKGGLLLMHMFVAELIERAETARRIAVRINDSTAIFDVVPDAHMFAQYRSACADLTR